MSYFYTESTPCRDFVDAYFAICSSCI